MKQFAAATLIALLGMGSASADQVIDIVSEVNHASMATEVTQLPATAAGKHQKMQDNGIFPSPDHG